MLKWPNGVKSVAFFTFDLDAETLWFSRNPKNWKSTMNRSRGAYGPNEGIPRILDMLARNDVKATFFIPGWVIENHEKVVRRIHVEGHEIAYHGYLHEFSDEITYDEENALMEKCESIIEGVTGKKPVGHRSPMGEILPHTARLLMDRGYRYSANLMDWDSPYFQKVDGKEVPLVEFPWDWMYDDSSYYFFTLQEPTRRGISSARTLFEIWQDEFDGLYEEGKMFCTVNHPQLCGRPSRIKTLERLIQHIKSKPGTWIARMDEVAGFLANQFPDRDGV